MVVILRPPAAEIQLREGLQNRIPSCIIEAMQIKRVLVLLLPLITWAGTHTSKSEDVSSRAWSGAILNTTPNPQDACRDGSAQLGCLTAPPIAEARSLRPHPRLLVTDESLPQLRKKLASPVYEKDIARIRASRNPTDQAFAYLIWDDEQAYEAAKAALMSGRVPPWKRMGKSIRVLQMALLYDWLYQSLDPTERAVALIKVKESIPAKLRNYHGTKIPYYFNDIWSRGQSFVPLAALALAGDDSWADGAVESAYTSEHYIFSPYYGGVVDTLNTLSLKSGGGLQVGTNPVPGTGYESFFLIGAPLFLASWQSATGEELLSKTNFLKMYPYYALQSTDNGVESGDSAKQVFEYVTGMYPGDAANLSAWMLQKYGRSKHALCLRLILGDLTSTTPSSPPDLGIPLASFLQGADLVTSRTGWEDDDISVFMFARHWDTARYEPDSGIVSIYRGSKPLLVRGTAGKRAFDGKGVSSVWIWEQGNIEPTLGQGASYRRSLIPTNPERATSAIPVLSPGRTEFRPETLIAFSFKDGKTKATTRYEKLLLVADIEKAERTLVHEGRHVRLIDSLEGVPTKARVAWALRLAETPVISGNVISTGDLTVTLRGPESDIVWSGGVGKELVGPTGKWHGNKKGGFSPGYSKSTDKTLRFGSGYVFAIPKRISDEYKFDARIEIK